MSFTRDLQHPHDVLGVGAAAPALEFIAEGGIDAPMDKAAEARLAVPGHAGIAGGIGLVQGAQTRGRQLGGAEDGGEARQGEQRAGWHQAGEEGGMLAPRRGRGQTRGKLYG